MEYKNVLFDLGGVLIDLDVQRAIRTFSALLASPVDHVGHPQTISELVTAEGLMGGHTSQLIDRYQVGEISTDAFIHAIQQQCHPGTTYQQVVDAWYVMLDGMRDEKSALLQSLAERGKNIYVLSNINELHVEWTLKNCPALKIAKRLFFSNEIGMSKPDPRCYELVLRETGINPAETVYVDDLPANIEAGRAFGFQCLHVVDDTWMKQL